MKERELKRVAIGVIGMILSAITGFGAALELESEYAAEPMMTLCASLVVMSVAATITFGLRGPRGDHGGIGSMNQRSLEGIQDQLDAISNIQDRLIALAEIRYSPFLRAIDPPPSTPTPIEEHPEFPEVRRMFEASEEDPGLHDARR